MDLELYQSIFSPSHTNQVGYVTQNIKPLNTNNSNYDQMAKNNA